MSTEKEETKTDTISVARVDSDLASAENGQSAEPEPRRPMATKRALIAWLVLCFSVSLVPRSPPPPSRSPSHNSLSWEMGNETNVTMFGRRDQPPAWPSATSPQSFNPAPMS